MKVTFDKELLNYRSLSLYPASGCPLLACHPRDLIGMASTKPATTSAAADSPPTICAGPGDYSAEGRRVGPAEATP